MNRYLIAASAFAGVICAAAPASAATVVYTSGSVIALTYEPMTQNWDGAFRFRVVNTRAGLANGLFTANFTFQSPVVHGEASAIATNIIVRGNLRSDIDFTNVSINGTGGTVENFGAASMAYTVDAPITLGLNTLTLSGRLNPRGNGVGDGLVTGSLTLMAVPVPEPTAWSLLIVGFGAVGAGLRRRTATGRSARYQLNFA